MASVEQLPYLPFADRGAVVDGAFRWRLGVRPLDLDDWIELGPDAEGPDGWIAEKQRICSEHHATVFASLDGIEDESNEVATVLIEHLRGRWPSRYGGGRLDSVLETGLHPLDAVARLVPEDLVLMVERVDEATGERRLVFGAGSVCFPNRWDLQSKLGLTMAEVHAPVAELNRQLEPQIDTFLHRLTPERSFWRLGWGIIETSDGYTPLDGTGARVAGDLAPQDLFVRVERETLRRFPRTGCVLFTIRTYVSPIATVVARDRTGHQAGDETIHDGTAPAAATGETIHDGTAPAAATGETIHDGTAPAAATGETIRDALAAAVQAMGYSVRDYKNLTGHVDRLTDWLRA